MMNLFSVFDPMSYFGISINWVIVFLVFMYLPLKYYMLSSKVQGVFKFIVLTMNKMFVEIAGSSYLGMVFVVVSSFIYLTISNLLGLFPFIFTASAHPVMVMGVGVVMWLSFFLMGWTKNFIESAAHLVPEGSPLALSPLMVMIESISHLMRPFTLSIRLAANMMAGHLIVGLLASISTIGGLGFFLSFFLQSVMMVLEMGVSIIQGFVFSILLLLYSLEYY